MGHSTFWRAGVLHEFLRLAGSAGDSVDLAVLFDAKPATGLPVLAIPSTTSWVHFSSMPITMTAATFRVAAGADQGAEMEVKVGTELQTAIRMLDGNGAADVIGNGVASGLREVVQGGKIST